MWLDPENKLQPPFYYKIPFYLLNSSKIEQYKNAMWILFKKPKNLKSSFWQFKKANAQTLTYLSKTAQMTCTKTSLFLGRFPPNLNRNIHTFRQNSICSGWRTNLHFRAKRPKWYPVKPYFFWKSTAVLRRDKKRQNNLIKTTLQRNFDRITDFS